MRRVYAWIDAIIACALTPLFRFFKAAYIPYTVDFMGLGNRLKGLANFYAYGSRRFFVLWRTEGWVTSPWRDLFRLRGGGVFELNECAAYRIFGKVFRKWLPNGVLSPRTPFWGWVLPKEARTDEYLEDWYSAGKLFGKRYSIDFQFDRTEQRWQDFFVPFFKVLEPSPEVRERIATVKIDSQMVAVQIRNSNIKADTAYVATLDHIIDAMNRYPIDTRFFISAMNGDVASVFHRHFGERVVELPGKRYKSMVDSVADMYLLGECGELVSSPGSSFSEVAWWWSLGRGNKTKVTMLARDYNQADL